MPGLLFPQVGNIARWEPVLSPVSCCPRCRSPDHLVEVVASFEVELNPRYQADAQNTYCNIFVRDVCRALGAWLPDTVLRRRTVTCWSCRHPAQELAWLEQNANALIDWLVRDGPRYGWRQLDAGEAVLEADRGLPVVATYRAPDTGTGHLALVIPSTAHRPAIAQAGATCLFDAALAAGFGALPVRFFSAP